MQKETIIVAAFTFLGAFLGGALATVIGFVNSYLDRKARREEVSGQLLTEKQLAHSRSLCDQLATFYRLEQLYLAEIASLRGAGDTRGIMNEFRAKAYADGNPRIELNDSSALAEKEAYFGAPQPVA